MADDRTMNQIHRTAQKRMQKVQDLITQLRAVDPRIAPHLAEATMLDAADELEQLIGGARE